MSGHLSCSATHVTQLWSTTNYTAGAPPLLNPCQRSPIGPLFPSWGPKPSHSVTPRRYLDAVPYPSMPDHPMSLLGHKSAMVVTLQKHSGILNSTTGLNAAEPLPLPSHLMTMVITLQNHAGIPTVLQVSRGGAAMCFTSHPLVPQPHPLCCTHATCCWPQAAGRLCVMVFQLSQIFCSSTQMQANGMPSQATPRYKKMKYKYASGATYCIG